LHWYKVNGSKHQLVSRIAARVLARPDANSLQERVFSFCKRIDSPLRQQLGDDKFGMLSVLAFNRQFIKRMTART
jgi:hypothetical protein